MRRREFIAGLGGAAAWPVAARAQRQKGIPRLCFLTGDRGTAQSPSPRFEGFFQGLRELGYVSGQNLFIDYISSNGHTELFPELAAECVRLNPDIIAVTITPATRALKELTHTIPIVMVALGDPVGTGLVDTLAKPGGNITGMSQMTSGLAAKRLELLKETVPTMSRVLVLAYLVDPISPLQVQAMKDAAPSLGMTLQIHDIQTAYDLPSAFEAGVKDKAEGLITTAETIFRAERARVTELASSHKLPAIYPYATFAADNGGLMAYDISDRDLHTSAAMYVDRILKGAKPSELPVQQPTKFRLVLNLKTAKALGLTVSNQMQLLADEVIE